jgi:hypothetical protein
MSICLIWSAEPASHKNRNCGHAELDSGSIFCLQYADPQPSRSICEAYCSVAQRLVAAMPAAGRTFNMFPLDAIDRLEGLPH